MNSLYQLSQSTRLDRASSLFEVHDCEPGYSRLAREALIREFLRLRPDLIEILRIDHPFVLAASLVSRVQDSRFGHHGQIDSARPASG
jgi:hypothetical protein